MKFTSILCAAVLAVPFVVVSCGGTDQSGVLAGNAGTGSTTGGNANANVGGSSAGKTGGNSNSAAGGNAQSSAGGNAQSSAGGNAQSAAGGNTQSAAGGNAHSAAGGNSNSATGGNSAAGATSSGGNGGAGPGTPITLPTGTCPASPQVACTLADVGLVCPGAQQGSQCSCVPGGGGISWQCKAQSAMCPATPPVVASACTAGDYLCSYTGARCSCTQGAWQCETCPATQPQRAGSCTRLASSLACTYGTDLCTCRQQQQQQQQQSTYAWACFAPPAPQPAGCPQARPQVGMNCADNTPVATMCTYLSDNGPQLCTCAMVGNLKKWGCVPAIP